jgi:hypothetical protein
MLPLRQADGIVEPEQRRRHERLPAEAPLRRRLRLEPPPLVGVEHGDEAAREQRVGVEEPLQPAAAPLHVLLELVPLLLPGAVAHVDGHVGVALPHLVDLRGEAAGVGLHRQHERPPLRRREPAGPVDPLESLPAGRAGAVHRRGFAGPGRPRPRAADHPLLDHPAAPGLLEEVRVEHGAQIDEVAVVGLLGGGVVGRPHPVVGGPQAGRPGHDRDDDTAHGSAPGLTRHGLHHGSSFGALGTPDQLWMCIPSRRRPAA